MKYFTQNNFNFNAGHNDPFLIKQFKKSKVIIFSLLSLLFVLTIQPDASAQVTQLEQSSTSYIGVIPNGPSIDPVKARFVNNTSGNTFVTVNPEINVTASFSDQQFTNVAGTSTKTGNFFGGAVNDKDKTPIPQAAWKVLNSISGSNNAMYTSNPKANTGKGIDVAGNYGFNIFTSVEPLWKANKNPNSRYYYSKLTLTFNRAVSNPVIHIVGLGATTTVSGLTHGFATELELDQPASGITLAKLSGSSALTVANNKIINNKSSINEDSNIGAATGSIRVTGNNITTLVFKIYIKGDNRGTAWSDKDMFAGDQWLMGFSMNASSISGNVFDDGNALTDSKVNPVPNADDTGTNADNQLFVNLVNNSDQIVATADVAQDGGYIFQDIVSASYPAAYKVVLTTDKTKVTPSLPDGWINTGEFKGAPVTNGNDGTIDGILAGITLTNATTVITDVNFGIEKIPVSTSKTEPSQQNAAGTAKVTVPVLTGSDLEDGVYNGISKTNTIKITSLPTSQTGILYYDNAIVTLNQVINNYDPAKLKVDPADGNQILVFTYSHKDAAGKYAVPALVTMPFYPVFVISGNVFDDADGLVAPANKVDGTAIKGSDTDAKISGSQTLYITLMQESWIVSTVAVQDDGSYSFQNIPADDYVVVLQNAGLDGSISASLPVDWKNTGENKGLPTIAGSDGKVDGKLAFSVLDEYVTNLNFGINKLPDADSKKQIILTPSADVTLDGKGNNPPALSGSDLEDGTLGSAGSVVAITQLPTNGELYYKGVKVTAINTALDANFSPSQLTFKFAGSGYNKIQFKYAFIDKAGMQGNEAVYELSWSGSLPVTLTRFTAYKSEQTAVLNWVTTAETNSDRFDIQHSTDGKEWNIIGSVPSVRESTMMVTYSFTDVNPSRGGENLYRLKMVDQDETFAYSRINSLTFDDDVQTSVYPNPAISTVKMTVDGKSDLSNVKNVKIFDLNGRVVLTPLLLTDEIDVQKLNGGLYLMQITRNNGIVSTLKITVKK